MVLIIKGNEPEEWLGYRNTEGVGYAANAALRNALLSEQGYICAYCMRRIPVTDPDNSETSRIEHIQCRDRHKDLELMYENMVVCCPGFINAEEHCDKAKHDSDIRFTPLDPNVQLSISYSTKNGEIKSNNVGWNKDINEILKLNNAILKANRYQTLEGIRAVLERRKWKTAEITNKLAEWSEFDNKGRRKPYCGIIIWYLQKKLR